MSIILTELLGHGLARLKDKHAVAVSASPNDNKSFTWAYAYPDGLKQGSIKASTREQALRMLIAMHHQLI